MAQKASDMESVHGYGFRIIWKGIWYVISEFIGHYFDTFTNKTEQIQIGTFPSFQHKSDLSDENSFPCPRKQWYAFMNTVPCKMIIDLILDGLLGDKRFPILLPLLT